MIKKIGIDIVANSRIKALLNDETFCKRILSSLEEKKFCEITSDKRKTEYLAGRFAAKEAFIKALPKGYSIKHYRDINVLNDDDGAPFIRLDDFPLTINLSISHEEEYTVAMVVIEE